MFGLLMGVASGVMLTLSFMELVALGISLHNMPEGMAVGAGYIHLPESSVFVALIVADRKRQLSA